MVLHDPSMSILTPEEFLQMERLLADLLPHTRPEEEAALLYLHARLQVIYTAQSCLNASRDRLMALGSQTL